MCVCAKTSAFTPFPLLVCASAKMRRGRRGRQRPSSTPQHRSSTACSRPLRPPSAPGVRGAAQRAARRSAARAALRLLPTPALVFRSSPLPLSKRRCAARWRRRRWTRRCWCSSSSAFWTKTPWCAHAERTLRHMALRSVFRRSERAVPRPRGFAGVSAGCAYGAARVCARMLACCKRALTRACSRCASQHTGRGPSA
jgi:hypothetical protein